MIIILDKEVNEAINGCLFEAVGPGCWKNVAWGVVIGCVLWSFMFWAISGGDYFLLIDVPRWFWRHYMT